MIKDKIINMNNDINTFDTFVLKEGESKETIYKDYNILQNNNFFKFGIDSFLLSKFFLENTNLKHIHIADFCSGTGIIGIFTYLNILHNEDYNNHSLKKTNIHNLNIDFFEIQEYFADLNKRNCNHIYNMILEKADFKDVLNPFTVNNLDIQNILYNLNFKNKYTCILSNPPYMKENKGIKTNSSEKDIAKIAKKDFLKTFFEVSNFCLKDKGELFIVHKPENLTEIIILATNNNLELKLLQFITNSSNKAPSLFLAKFVKNGKTLLKLLPQKTIN